MNAHEKWVTAVATENSLNYWYLLLEEQYYPKINFELCRRNKLICCSIFDRGIPTTVINYKIRLTLN